MKLVNVRGFYTPNKYTVYIFLFLFAITFFIPYLQSQPSVGTTELIPEGRYPLIFIFLMSSVVVMELLMGSFILGDITLFLLFLLAFFILYTISCSLGNIIKRNKEKSKIIMPRAEQPDDSYVLNLETEEYERKDTADINDSND